MPKERESKLSEMLTAVSKELETLLNEKTGKITAAYRDWETDRKSVV